jgi:hypothetical protein
VVVVRAGGLVEEHGGGVVDPLHLLVGGARSLVLPGAIRVVQPHQTFVSPADLCGGGPGRDPEDLVEIELGFEASDAHGKQGYQGAEKVPSGV